MVGNLIQQQFFAADNWPFGAALTTVMMAFLLVWMVLYLRSRRERARRRCESPARDEAPRARIRGRAGREPPKDFDRPRFLRVYVGLFFVFLFAPIAIVVLFSFNSSKSLQNFDGFSLRWYEQLLRVGVAARLAGREHPDRAGDDGRRHRRSARCSPTGSCARARAGAARSTC